MQLMRFGLDSFLRQGVEEAYSEICRHCTFHEGYCDCVGFLEARYEADNFWNLFGASFLKMQYEVDNSAVSLLPICAHDLKSVGHYFHSHQTVSYMYMMMMPLAL